MNSIAANATFQFVTDAIVTPDDTNLFKNTVTVTGATQSGATCEAMDMVTVKRNPPPPPPFDCSDAKPIVALQLVWDGASGVNIVTEGGEVINGIDNGEEIMFSTEGLGNDIDLTISGAVSGSSRFHVSCSDDEMDGEEDCGTRQGNGKGNDAGKVNDWLLEGMIGEGGALDCSALP